MNNNEVENTVVSVLEGSSKAKGILQGLVQSAVQDAFSPPSRDSSYMFAGYIDYSKNITGTAEAALNQLMGEEIRKYAKEVVDEMVTSVVKDFEGSFKTEEFIDDIVKRIKKKQL